jgi:uncharacterized RDD family membrane protein YckC
MSLRLRAIEIQTPEGVRFSLLLAGPLVRFIAWLIDAVAIIGISQMLGRLLPLAGVISADLVAAAGLILYFVVSVGYGIALEWRWRGQTLGKRLLRLRVMDGQGLHLRFNQVVVRNLMRPVDSAPALYMAGGLACLLSANAQRLGDLAAGTIVVRAPKLPHPDLAQLLEGKFNSLLAYDQVVRRLRQRATPEAAGIAIQALMRRDQFEPTARVEVFREIAAYFAALAEFPEEALAQLTDEQYVRNVVEILAGRTRHGAASTPAPG